MQNKNFTIIEDIFNTTEMDTESELFPNEYNNQKKSFLRSSDNGSMYQGFGTNVNHNSYPTGNIPVLSYDEEMIKRKFNKQVNPRSISNQYNSLNSSNRILQPPLQSSIQPSQQSQQQYQQPSQINRISSNQQIQGMTATALTSHISCRNIYDHIENCPICSKYYKQSNRIYILIIIFLILIILLLLRQQK
jgi:hypothetical protein